MGQVLCLLGLEDDDVCEKQKCERKNKKTKCNYVTSDACYYVVDDKCIYPTYDTPCDLDADEDKCTKCPWTCDVDRMAIDELHQQTLRDIETAEPPPPVVDVGVCFHSGTGGDGNKECVDVSGLYTTKGTCQSITGLRNAHQPFGFVPRSVSINNPVSKRKIEGFAPLDGTDAADDECGTKLVFVCVGEECGDVTGSPQYVRVGYE
jgi:hypothetical protein